MSVFDNEPLLYANRQNWADVKPLPQYENVNPLAPILYTPEYADVTDYFRGIVKKGELSERVLELTEHLIRLNPAHYSAWQYRYKTLMTLGSSLEDELRLMDELAISFLKTYQVWHHRRLIITQTRKPGPELSFISQALQEDSKNYHTWSYRQWLLAHFNDDELWAGELDFVESMLAADLRNNSAWHHRFFVVFQCGVRKDEEDREAVFRRELVFTKQKISLAPNNASAWNYLRGVLEHTKTPFSTQLTFVEPYTVALTPESKSSPDDPIDLENPRPSQDATLPCPLAVEFLADIRASEGPEGVYKAIELWKSLAEKLDTIRKRYWEYKIKEALQPKDES